jgi:Zn-dependent peptidase ImmA (M78 family)
MASRRPGKRLLTFSLFGNQYEVRTVKKGHAKLDGDPLVYGMCYMEERVIYLCDSNGITLEQQQATLLHEIQHLIEDHYCIDHEIGSQTNIGSEQKTDQISLGWLYVIRGCPEVTAFVTKKTV